MIILTFSSVFLDVIYNPWSSDAPFEINLCAQLMGRFLILEMGMALLNPDSLNFQCDHCIHVSLPLCGQIILVLDQLLVQSNKLIRNSLQCWKELPNPYHNFSDKEDSSIFHQWTHETGTINDKGVKPFIEVDQDSKPT